MVQLTPQSRIFLATQPVDFRKGIDGLAAVCRQVLGEQPLSGAVYVFRNRSSTAIKILFYDQYLRQLRNTERELRDVNTAQAGDLVEKPAS